MDLVYKHEKRLFIISAVIASILWLAITIGTVGVVLIYLLLGYLFFLFTHSAFITHLKGNGVRITEQQYPDLFDSLKRNSEKVGLHHVPESYLLRTDFFNALATRFRGRNFVVLFTDVVDALENQPGAIDFYIGHELGHLHRKHLQWSVFLFPAAFIPLLGAAYRRAQEYTCDRYGAMCCNSDADVVAVISTISAGDSRWNTMNLDAYLQQINETDGFWMSFNELNNDYPWLTKRMAAAMAFRQQQDASFPSRHGFAWFLSMFVPRFGGGAAMSIIMTMVIVGILAAIAIPAYQDYIVKAQVVEAYQQAEPFKDAVEQYANENEVWPTSLSDLGASDDVITDPDGTYNIGVYEEGVIATEVLINGEEEQYIVFEPSYEEGMISWICYGQDLDDKYLPPECR